MPVRFRSAPSHCGLSPYTGRYGPLVLCKHTTSGPYLPVHGSMLIVYVYLFLLKGIQILGDPALSLHGKSQVDTVSKQKALSVLLK